MKIQCEVCNKHHASFFCTADEAALCDACDQRVASKHHRFSLTHPSSKHFPRCDVCQERRAFVFCQQDRAILCTECDVSIHSANDLTKKHNRFVLTGIKFSATATPYSPPPKKNRLLDSHPPSNSPSTQPGGSTSSSISEYLINTIPGMMFEDFLDSHSLPFADELQNGDDVSSMFGEGNMVSFSGGGIWVPEAPSSSSSSVYSTQMDQHGEITRGFGDDNFIVPQMSSLPNNVSKRSRLLW